jgi:hypothetical protein
VSEILELSALAPVRPQARVRTDADPDGTLYELAVPEDFGAVALRELGNRYAEVEGLVGSEGKLTKAQEKRLEKLLDEVVAALVRDIPAETVAALPYMTKRALAMRFFVGLGDDLTGLMGERAQTLISAAATSES